MQLCCYICIHVGCLLFLKMLTFPWLQNVWRRWKLHFKCWFELILWYDQTFACYRRHNVLPNLQWKYLKWHRYGYQTWKLSKKLLRGKPTEETHKAASVWGKKKLAFNHSMAVKLAFFSNSTELWFSLLKERKKHAQYDSLPALVKTFVVQKL